MALDTKLIALAQAIGADVKALKAADGDLTALSTTAKTNLVAAINEVYAAVGSAGATINDAVTVSAIETYSVTKINNVVTTACNALHTSLLGGASAAFDTFKELQDAMGADATLAATLSTAIANRVRYDAEQTLTAGQQTQARTNIGAASAADLSTLTTGLGSYDTDFATAYTTAKT